MILNDKENAIDTESCCFQINEKVLGENWKIKIYYILITLLSYATKIFASLRGIGWLLDY